MGFNITNGKYIDLMRTTLFSSLMTKPLVLLMVLFCAQAQALEVTASVDKNPVMVDESFTLQVTADDDMDVNAFDPSPLLKDFVVGRTSVSRQTQMVNFDTTKITRWNTVLIPRKEGRYTIPALTVEGKSTQPIKLMVIPVSASQQGQSRDLYVTTEVDTQQAYLQTQIRYIAKLYLAVDLKRGSLESPKMTDADIRQIGKDKEYTDIVDGRRYRIIERTFAIIPQKSGKFTLNGPLFEGEIVDNSNSQSFGFFKRTKNISRVGPAIDIEVLPVPDNYPHHWLPSDFVQLTEEWQPGSDEYKVGEPITRTISLTAVGLVEEQLPEINSQYPDQVKTYPDQANTATVERNDNLIAQRTESIAMIPNSPGKIQIPAVSVPWFNVVTGQTEYARLPARTITVAAGAQTTSVPTSNTPKIDTPEQKPDQLNVSAKMQQPTNTYWSISSSILLFLWLFTLLLWWRLSRRNKPRIPKQPSAMHNTVSDKKLSKVLDSEQPASVLPLLTRWLGEYCHNPGQSLAASQQQLDNQKLNTEISLMLSCLYAKQTSNWNSQNLNALIKELSGQKSQQSKHNRLEPLYPVE